MATEKALEYAVTVEQEYGETEFVVKFEQELTKEWLDEWQQVFRNYATMEQHARHIINILIRFPVIMPSILIGYGPIKYTGMKSWELTVWNGKGEPENVVNIERLPMKQEVKIYGKRKKRKKRRKM